MTICAAPVWDTAPVQSLDMLLMRPESDEELGLVLEPELEPELESELELEVELKVDVELELELLKGLLKWRKNDNYLREPKSEINSLVFGKMFELTVGRA